MYCVVRKCVANLIVGKSFGFGMYIQFTIGIVVSCGLLVCDADRTKYAVVPVYLILYFAFGLYKPRRTYKNIFSEATQIIKVNILAFITLVSILFIINQPDFQG